MDSRNLSKTAEKSSSSPRAAGVYEFSCWTQIFFSYIGIGIRRGWMTDRKLHVDTLIFIPTWKFYVFSYSRQIGNFWVLWRNTTNSYVIPQKASLWNFLVNTLLLYIPLLTPTDGQNYGWRSELILVGLGNLRFLQVNEYTCFAWAGGTFFPVVLLCQFFVLVGNRFWFYILLCT